MKVRKRGLLSLALAAFLSLNYIFPVSAEEKPASEETTADVSSAAQADPEVSEAEDQTQTEEPAADTSQPSQPADNPLPDHDPQEDDQVPSQEEPSALSDQLPAEQPGSDQNKTAQNSQNGLCSVNFQVRNPNQTVYSDFGTIDSTANAPISELNLPSESVLPESKTENGTVYRLTDWYLDSGLSTKAESADSDSMTLYAAYLPPAAVYVREPNQTDFTKVRESYLPPGSPASDAIPDTIPITKTENGQLYVLSGWYEDSAMSRRSSPDHIADEHSYYAAYTLGAELELQTLINAQTGDPIWHKNFSFTLAAAGTGPVVIRPAGSTSGSTASDRMNASLAGQSSSRCYVTAGASVTVTEADYASEGISEYGSSTGKFSISDPGTMILSAGPKIIPADSTGSNAVVFRFLNSKSPYVPRTRIYTYGKLPDNTWVGLGLAEARGPKLPDSSDTEPSAVNPAQLESFKYPDSIAQKPASSSITIANGYPIITYNGKQYTYAASNSPNTSTDGYYTLTWGDLTGGNNGAEAGANNFYTPESGRNTYRMDAVVHLIDTSQLTVKVRQPGNTSFTDLNGYGPKEVETSELLSDIIAGIPAAELPATKTVNGINYELKWYSDQNLNQPLDQNQPVDSDRTIYASYQQIFTVRYFTRLKDGSFTNTPDLTVNVAAGTPLASLEMPASISGVDVARSKILSYWYTTRDTTTRFNFSGTINSNIDLYAKFEDAVKVTVNKVTNPASLQGPFQIDLYGGTNEASMKAPIRIDPTSTTSGLVRTDGVNHIVATLNNNQSTMIWIPQYGQLRVTEDNPNNCIQQYRWGNFIGDLESLDSNPLNVTTTQILTVFNSEPNPPSQSAYFYGQIRLNGSTVNYGLGQGSISGPLIFSADQAITSVDYKGTQLGNNVQPLVTSINLPASYPDLEIDGKTYKYGYPSPGTAGDYYTLNWKNPITVENSVASGVNNMFTPSQTKNYRQNADIVLHPYTSFTLASENVNGTGDADPDYEVTYIVQFQPNGNTDPIIAPTGTNIIKDNDNQYKIKLKSSQNVSFSVPVGISVSVTDDVDQKLYTPSWDLNGSDQFTQNQIAHSVSIPGPTTITFRNTRNLIVPTDYESPDILPYLIMAGLLVGLFVLMNRRKKA